MTAQNFILNWGEVLQTLFREQATENEGDTPEFFSLEEFAAEILSELSDAEWRALERLTPRSPNWENTEIAELAYVSGGEKI